MTHAALVSVFAPDQRGLVSGIAGLIFDLGGDLGDATFAVLGEGAEFATVCELPDEISIDELKDRLSGLPSLAGADITVARFPLGTRRGETAKITHRVEISGRDRPGVLARIAELLSEYEANIVRLESQRTDSAGEGLYVMRMALSIPVTRAPTCLAALSNTAAEMRLECTVQPVTGSKSTD